MTIDYAAAGDLLERYGRAWETFDGDAWIELFDEAIEYHEDPFEAPIVGHLAVRAQADVSFTVERHWVVDPTILAAWHADYVERSTQNRVRLAGFMTLEIRDGRISRLREWYHRQAAPAR
jgi:hypothetical protein